MLPPPSKSNMHSMLCSRFACKPVCFSHLFVLANQPCNIGAMMPQTSSRMGHANTDINVLFLGGGVASTIGFNYFPGTTRRCKERITNRNCPPKSHRQTVVNKWASVIRLDIEYNLGLEAGLVKDQCTLNNRP